MFRFSRAYSGKILYLKVGGIGRRVNYISACLLRIDGDKENMSCDNCGTQDGGTGFAEKVDGIKELQEDLRNADTEELSRILKDHLAFGNNKLPNDIAIFNLGSAKDCPNYQTPSCQVFQDPETDTCYARKAEKQYPSVLPYRRRQQYIWNEVSAKEFAEAFIKMYERKLNPVDYLRFNESGDFATQEDVEQAEEIARILDERLGVKVYTYSASDHVDFTVCDYLTVNASNPDIEGYDQQFIVVDSKDDIPDSGFRCFGDCSDCKACMTGGGDGDIYEVIH